MADKLSPFVYWGQNNDKIFIKIDLKEVSEPQVDLQDDHLQFSANGVGVRGKNNYAFFIEFYLPTEPEDSQFRVTDRFVEFQIKKVGVGEIWPRLTYDQKKPAWLKIDFDHFAFNDSDDELPEPGTKTEEEQILEQIEKEIKNSPNQSIFSDMKKYYLFVYNMFMWVGYSTVFFILSFRYWRDGEASKKTAFDAVVGQLVVCQLAAILEVLHPFFGFVKTSPFMPMLQVFGRNLVLFGIIAQEPKIQEREVVWWLFITWSAVELVRYPYYMLNVVDMEWKVITWLRYTVWIPLYPLGFIFEGFVMLLSLPYFEQSERWTVALPNAFNMSFHFPTFLRIYMLAFFPGMYLLMSRMYEQRKKKIKPARVPRRLPKKKTT